MRHLMCTCLKCGGQNHLQFEEPYPQYGEQFVRYCRHCEEDTAQTMALTKKVATELRKQKAEEELQQSIIDCCNKYGFTCRFLFESVIITTPISSWQFAYHESKKTLRHESTTKINFDTGDYAFTHEQFRNKKMSCEEVIDYIAGHDKRKAARKARRKKGYHTMNIFIITCSFNVSQTVIDCAFSNEADAKAYADALNSDKAKAIARCKELIARRDSEAMVKFLDEEGSITFDVLLAELK